MESEGSGAREHGIWSFPESRSKKGHAAEPKVGNFWGHFFLTSGPQQFSFDFTFRLRISKKVILVACLVPNQCVLVHFARHDFVGCLQRSYSNITETLQCTTIHRQRIALSLPNGSNA